MRLTPKSLALFAKRRAISIEVAKNKLFSQRPIRDQRREQRAADLSDSSWSPDGAFCAFYSAGFQRIIEDSVLIQQDFVQQQKNPEQQDTGNSVAYLRPLFVFQSGSP